MARPQARKLPREEVLAASLQAFHHCLDRHHTDPREAAKHAIEHGVIFVEHFHKRHGPPPKPRPATKKPAAKPAAKKPAAKKPADAGDAGSSSE